MVTVSVIIPTLVGREHLLKMAISSVLDQTFQDFEIIVISNGKPALSISDSRIKVIIESLKDYQSFARGERQNS